MSLSHGQASTSLPLVTFYFTSPSPTPCGPSDNTIRRFTAVFHFLFSLRLRLGLDKHFKNLVLLPLSMSQLGPCEPHKNVKDVFRPHLWFSFGTWMLLRIRHFHDWHDLSAAVTALDFRWLLWWMVPVFLCWCVDFFFLEHWYLVFDVEMSIPFFEFFLSSCSTWFIVILSDWRISMWSELLWGDIWMMIQRLLRSFFLFAIYVVLSLPQWNSDSAMILYLFSFVLYLTFLLPIDFDRWLL